MCRQQGLSAVPAEDLSLWGSLEVLLSHASSACFNLIDSIPREVASSFSSLQIGDTYLTKGWKTEIIHMKHLPYSRFSINVNYYYYFLIRTPGTPIFLIVSKGRIQHTS